MIGRPKPRFEDHPAEQWVPVRTLRNDTDCSFCGFLILKGSPGRSAGTRGTLCWFNPERRQYECLGCRSEAMRAEDARASAPAPVVEERCDACRFVRESDSRDWRKPIFGLTSCDGCELGSGRGVHRTCPRCKTVEHRAYARHCAQQAAA